MAKKINILAASGGNIPVANNGLKLSETILIEKIEEDKRFKSLFTIDENLLQRIADSMKVDNYDDSQPLHIWYMKDAEDNTHYILIDGYTRMRAAIIAGLKSVPYFKHQFNNFEDAYRYVLKLQVNRRNLEGIDLLKNIGELMGSDYIQSIKGNKNEAIGKELGVSGKTIERAQKVNSKANKEQLRRIESGESSVNQVYTEIMQQETVDEEADDEQRTRLGKGTASVKDIYTEIKKNNKNQKRNNLPFADPSAESASIEFDDITDSISSLEDTPTALNFSHTDGKERPVVKTGDVPDFEEKIIKARQESYQEGYDAGYREGAGEFGEKLFCYALAEARKGRTPEEVYHDITDFSGSEIIRFQSSEENEAIIQSWEAE
nr:ParB/Srx family N-terminal domain-containing protein [Treponema socranskii]